MLNVRIRILQNWVTIRDGEITHLRTKVAAADIFRDHAGTFVSNAIKNAYLSEQWGNLTAAYDATKTEGTASPVGGMDAHLENVKRMSFIKRKKFWDELQQRAYKGREGWVVSWPDVLLLVRPEDWEAAILSVTSEEQALRRNIDAVRTAFGAKAEDAPPAVADAGETGTERCDERFKLMLEINEHVERNYGEQAALRRDVEAVSLEVRDATCTIVDTRDNMMYELKERIERLESRERPEPGTIEVTAKMAQAAVNCLLDRKGFQVTSQQVTWLDVQAMIKAALAVRKAGR